MRSLPIAGIAFQLLLRKQRLRAACEEDAAYRRTMFELGERPLFAGASEKQERYVLSGELLGHVVAWAAGGVAYVLGAPVLVLPVTGAVAFCADWLGGRVALRLFEREGSTVDAIVGEVQRDRSD